MKNKMSDLNNHLFAQLERLSDEELKGDDLEKEIARTKSISMIAKDIANNAQLELKAKELAWEWNKTKEGDLPAMLEG